MATVQQKSTTDRIPYLRKAARYAARKFRELRETPEYKYCHPSFAVARALELTETRYTDLGTFGVEGDCELNGEDHITIQYLNSGETYEPTICFWRGRFIVSSWGDIVENYRAE